MRHFQFALIILLVPMLAQCGSAKDDLLCDLNKAVASCAPFCQRCEENHSRTAEAVYPLAVEASLYGRRKMAEKALELGDWLLEQQRQDGAWEESAQTGWTGTTVDQLLSLTLAYPLLEDRMSDSQKACWIDGIRRAADYLAGFINIRVAYVNYCCTTAAAMAIVSELLGESKYMEAAKNLARFCITQINEDGLLEGEGEWNGTTKTGIDIGYNMDMSLWGLLKYSQIADDAIVRDAVIRSAAAHSWFIYPGGVLDCSAGLRSCKWTLYGSSTADGALPLYALLSEYDSAYLRAFDESLTLMNKCLSPSGILAPGPMYDKVCSAPPCIYHTFTRAKGLAMGMEWKAKAEPAGVLPYEKDTLVYFKSLNTAIVKCGPVRATICAYGYKSPKGAASRFMHRPSGGAVTLLWSDSLGVVQASSPNKYVRWESSFPGLPFEPRSATARVESIINGRTFTNLYEYDAMLTAEDQTHVSVSGLLKDENGDSCGVSYCIEYTFDGRGLTKTYSVCGADATVIEPVLDPEGNSKQYYPAIVCREDKYELRDGGKLDVRY